MARIKHIALTTKEPAKVAEFYKAAFGLKELRRSPNGAVFLTDGQISAASTISASRSTTSTRLARSWKARTVSG